MMTQQSQRETQMRQQMAAQEAQAQSEVGQMIGGGIAQAGQMIGQGITAAQTEQRRLEAANAQATVDAARKRGETIYNSLGPEIDTLRKKLVVLQATNGSPEVIEGLTQRLSSLESLLNVDDLASLPQLYNTISQATFNGRQDAPTIRELAAGRAAQELTPSMDLSELRNRAALEATVAERVLDMQIKSVEDFRDLINNFDPSKPETVMRTRAALEMSRNLSGPLQVAAQPLAERLRIFNADPQQQTLYNNALREADAKTQSVVAAANQAEEALRHSKEMNP
jgi:hypothetical protein